jgi:hypothetical protein
MLDAKSDESDSKQNHEPVEEYILMGLVFRVLSTDGAGIDASTNALIEAVSLLRGKNQTVQTRVEYIQEKDGKTIFASDM